MKLFKHILIFVSLFCILESTGISVLTMLTKYHLEQTDGSFVNDDENTSERNETRESRLKEYIPGDLLVEVPPIHVSSYVINYPLKPQHAHLGWVLPVPTPPPNCLV